MTKNEFNLQYWLFYLQLEEDFYNTLSYVEFGEDNFDAYSKVFAKQLVSIGAEIDIVCKALCEQIDSAKARNNITDYANILCAYEDFPNTMVQFSYNKEFYKPFDGWAPNNKPFWWAAYTEIKHHRAENNNIKLANLKKVFSALAALFILNRYLCKIVCVDKKMNEPEVSSKLFKMEGWEICVLLGNGLMLVASADGEHVSFDFDNE